MDYNEVWFSRSNFHKKKSLELIYRVFYFVNVGKKNVDFSYNKHFLAFLARSSEMENMFWRLHFKYFFRSFLEI